MQPFMILVVDDDQPIRDLLQAVLEDEGLVVAFARSGEEALASIDTNQGSFRGVITDVNLDDGGLTGWDVARHARVLVPGIPVIYVTGASAHQWGALGVPNSVLIQKPFAISQLTTALAALLNTGGPTYVAPA